ncbi:hypothetical protein QJS04_geneDACA024681 [Acorus gramineus]|uniref:Uncharacterized protein n=1 Tax=Acorus gramineus TaxID=55184 RepID=A0AAV9A142_ACOGR|nr:hypothetical protein QJS04_geneDACA024681 [Acorus gramineus]
MVHGILQFTPSIAFRYVLHRCESLDIRCRESSPFPLLFDARRGIGPALPAPGLAVAGKPAGWVRGRCHAPRPLSFLSGEFLGADRAGVVVRFPRPARGGAAPGEQGGGGATRTRGSAPGLPPGDVDDGFSWGGSSAGLDNDPSAGSPTETLLRLLLPLNDKVQWTSHNVAGGEPPSSPRSEHFTGPFNR